MRFVFLVFVALYALKTVHQFAVVGSLTGQWWLLLVGAASILAVYWTYRRTWVAEGARPAMTAALALELAHWPYPPCRTCNARVTSDAKCPKCRADQHVVKFDDARPFGSIDLRAVYPALDTCVHCLAEDVATRTFRFWQGEPRVRDGANSSIAAWCCERCWRQHQRSVRVRNFFDPIVQFVAGMPLLGCVILAVAMLVTLISGDETVQKTLAWLSGAVAIGGLCAYVLGRWASLKERIGVVWLSEQTKTNGTHRSVARFRNRIVAERVRHLQKTAAARAPLPKVLDQPRAESDAGVPAADAKPLTMGKRWILDAAGGALRAVDGSRSIPLTSCTRIHSSSGGYGPSGYEVRGHPPTAWINDSEIEDGPADHASLRQARGWEA
mgnify:FL=1